MVKKISIVLISIILVLSICGSVKAETGKTNLEVVEKSSEPKYFNNNNGNITKSIIECNSDNGEVTIESKYVNNSDHKNEITNAEKTEIFLVIDDSKSMKDLTKNGISRQQELVPEMYSFVEKIFSSYSNVKVGLIKYSSIQSITNGALILCDLTSDKQTIISAIDTYKETSPNGEWTNTQAGLKKANDSFSDECNNRIIVFFTDGLTNEDLNGGAKWNDRICVNTKNTLINIGDTGTYIITIMASRAKEVSNSSLGLGGFSTGAELIEYIFGTEEEPTTGSFYFASTENKEEILQKVITDTEKRVETTVVDVKNVKIEEYFPSEITDNFDFSYVGKPSAGNASDIDLKNRSITWNIDSTTKEATLKYKLKLKDKYNKEILDKILPINEKVELAFEDEQGDTTNVTQTSTPKIKLTGMTEENVAENKPEEQQQTQETPDVEEKVEEMQEIPTAENIVEEQHKDNTVIKNDIPTTGENIIPITILSVVIAVGIVMFVKNYIKIKKEN